MAYSDPPRAPFRLSQLIYDTRYRSMTIQVVTFLLVVLGIAWLINNARVNLAIGDVTLGLDFLSAPAGYDISFMLIDYNSQMSNARAALVGIYNTLLISALGCLTATIVGVIAGVLRLSSNWVVSRLMAVYVEGARNVPLVLWILLVFAVLTESTPQPRDFKPDESGVAEASMYFADSVAFTNRGTFVPAPIWADGAGWLAVVLALSLIAAWAYRRLAKHLLFETGRLLPMVWPALLILIVPSVLAFFLMGRPISLSYPELGGFNFKGGMNIPNPLIALWVALTFYTGAFIAENVRAGILAVSKGQSEAAFALGLRPNRTMSLVILPQAMRVIIPPLISQFLNLTKNSSLAIAVSYPDIRATLGGITLNQTGRALECMLLLGLFYLILSLAISTVMNMVNNRMKLRER